METKFHRVAQSVNGSAQSGANARAHTTHQRGPSTRRRPTMWRPACFGYFAKTALTY